MDLHDFIPVASDLALPLSTFMAQRDLLALTIDGRYSSSSA